MYNSNCPICGSSAYQGFSSIECSSSACSNFKKNTTAEPPNPFAGPNPPIFPPLPPPPVTTGVFAPSTSAQPTAVYPKIAPNTTIRKQSELKLQLIREAFFYVKAHCDQAVIAGGTPRDLILRRVQDINDVDIFVEGFNRQTFCRTTSLILTPALTNSKYSKFAVWNFSWQGQACQIIECPNGIEQHIKGFDFGINMVMITDVSLYNPSIGAPEEHFLIHQTPEFTKDAAYNTATFFPNQINSVGIRNIHQRWQSIQAKFPGISLQLG